MCERCAVLDGIYVYGKWIAEYLSAGVNVTDWVHYWNLDLLTEVKHV